MNRRTAMKSAALSIIPIIGSPLTTIAADMMPDIAVNDPLLDAISNYRNGLDDFNANAPGDSQGAYAYAEASFVLPQQVISEWSTPAMTKRGAIEAIRLANSELQAFDGPETVVAMVWAALAYFENEGRTA